LEDQKKHEDKKKLDAIKSIKMVIERPKKIPANACYILQPESLAKLDPGEWFNDELVNGYV
jgi:hypothetical protein